MIRRPTLRSIRDAAAAMADIVVHTPLIPLRTTEGDQDILLKPEILQPVTSFKIRGIFHAVASIAEEERSRGVSTVSAGNTAQALAWAGRHFGIPARSIMPDDAPRTKIDAVRSLGGTPVLVPRPEIFAYMREERWRDEPYHYVCPWTDPLVHTGHGSLGLEIAEDAPDIQSVFIPVGGGGLFVGVASALKAMNPAMSVFAVEPEGCPSLVESLRANRPVSVACHTMCDGVAVPYMTEAMFPLLRELVTDTVLVSEEEVVAGIRRLALDHKMIVEGAGALALAAALKTPREKRGKSVAILTGGSLDPEKLVAILGG